MIRYSFWAVGAAASFSLMAVFVKLASGDFNAFELVFWRALTTFIFMLCVVKARRLTLKTAYAGGHLVRGILGTISMLLWFFSLGRMPLPTNMTLIYTSPIFMAIVFIVLAAARKRPAPWGTIAAIGLGFIGIIFVLKPSFEEGMLWVALLCLSSAAVDTVVYFQMQYLGRHEEPSWRIVFYFALMTVCLAPIGAFFLDTGMHIPSFETALPLLGMGLCGTAGQLCTTKAYTDGNLLLSSCLGFAAIPFSAIIGIVLFGDKLDIATIFGIGFVITAGIFATIYTQRKEHH
ncbi:MAG TPA: EamA/RhaT family transporter [Sutterella sp.]|nr:EamA/RhaT family transporter [Sutterella sp.]